MIRINCKLNPSMTRKLFMVIFSFFTGVVLSAQLVVPVENPEGWLLAFVDVETTGLRPGYHEVIDIGVVLSDLDGHELDRLFLRIMPEHPERVSQGAIAVNAFSVERWKKLNALSQKIAVDSLIAFHRTHAGEKHVLMVAYNSHFDAAFLDHLFRSTQHSWRDLYYYYVLDIPSMAWAQGIRLLYGQKLSAYFGIPDEPHIPEEHTGITGADLNFRLYKKIVGHRDHN